LNIGVNQFGGTLPSGIGKWSSIQFFNVGTNSFVGTLPTTLGTWTGIQNFYMDKNGFTGSVPQIGKNFCPRNSPLGAAELVADCKDSGGAKAEISCACCSTCCDSNGENCAKDPSQTLGPPSPASSPVAKMPNASPITNNPPASGMGIYDCLSASDCGSNAQCSSSGKCTCLDGFYGDGRECNVLVFEEMTDITNAELSSILNWIKLKVVQIKNPFCWKGSYGRGVGEALSECPGDRDKIGALCYSKCPAGTERYGFDCHSVCPEGWRNDGLFCRRAEYGRGVGYPAWDWNRCEADNGSGNCEWWGALIYPKCASGFSPFGCCICRPQQPDCNALGLGGQLDLSCAKKIIIGDPTPLWCKTSLEQNGALCYQRCKSGYYGVGPVCWTACDSNQFSCAAACAIDESTCVWATVDAVSAPLILAFNIGTMGLGAPATGAATVAIKTASGATKIVGGTTKVTIPERASWSLK
jgi:hypothetical protein